MRKFIWLVTVLPSVCLADQFTLDAPVTHVTMHPTGATVERRVAFSIPQGTHELILRGADPSVPLSDLRLSVEGAVLETLSARGANLPPRSPNESAELTAARAEVRRIEREIRDLEDRRAEHLLGVAAAAAKQEFLARIGESDGIASQDVMTLRDLSTMIAEETLSAKSAAQLAQRAARALDDPLEDLSKALKRARQALAALVPDTAEQSVLSLTVTAETQSDGQVTISYLTPEAMWHPSYEARLTRTTPARLKLSRVAWVAQDSAETWRDVTLRLSTVDPDAPTDPTAIQPVRKRIMEPPEAKARLSADMQGAMMPAPMMEAPIMHAQSAAMGTVLDGISVTYTYDQPVTLAPGTDAVRIPLGDIALEAEVFARATPRYDDTAFVAASFTNDSPEILLPSDRVQLYLDGSFVGIGHLPLIAAGEQTELSFGPIEGLRLKSLLQERNEGDRGVLSKTNELSESRAFEVANLTGTDWPVRLRDRVPYSEQEDLSIKWSATPKPDITDVEGQRGVLEWQFPLAPGGNQTVRLETRLGWPQGYILR